MSVSVLKKGMPLTVAAVVLLMLAGTIGATAAFAEEARCPSSSCRPWWHLNTLSAPANPSGGEGTIVVEASDLGDAWVNAGADPVTIVDTLPAGVTPTAVRGEGETFTERGKALEEHISCSFAGQVVTCTLSGGRLLAYEHLLTVVNVKVTPGSGHGVNEVSVSGGGAPSLTSHRALALSDSPPYGVENYEITPEEEGGGLDTQAGSHPFQLTTTLGLNANTVLALNNVSGEIGLEVQPLGPFTKDLRFNLPPGLVGNPTPLPQCPMKVFVNSKKPEAPKCPDDTVVGVATPIAAGNNLLSNQGEVVLTEPLFNLEPALGEPARFGFQTVAGPVILDISVRTGGDYGVVVSVSDIPNLVEFIGNQVTFWGVPADPRHDNARGSKCLDHVAIVGFSSVEPSCPVKAGQPFLVMPTSCTGPLRTSMEADLWSQPGQFTAPKEYVFQNSEGEPLAQNGCNRLNFEPSISVSPDGTQGSSPTGLSVGVHVPQDASLNPVGLAESAVKEVTVALPAGIAVNPAAGDGLLACGLGEIALESAAEQTCPEASKIATVEIRTPLLPNPLVGALYLAAQDANPFGSLIAVYIVARDPVSGVLLKLAGEVKPDAVTGQLVATFKVPPVPFEDGVFHFFGGSRAPLGTPALCGSYTTTASISPWSGNAPVDSSSEFLITSGPNHSPCSNPLPFSPSLTTGSLNLQAGAFTPFTTTMSRADGQQNLQGIQLHMPPGLSGLLTGVKLCGEAEANAGTCGPESLIGETTVSVGLGGNPFSVKGGRVYITGPHDGAPFGLSIVNPAKAGPYDLEKNTLCDCVVVRAKIEVDPHTAALTITTDNTGPYKIPTILQGIPLEIQHVNVIISREHFTFNPTNCNKMAITGSLQSTEGASSALSVPFQVTNCATLKFAPKFAVSTAGKTSRAKGASLSVKLTYPQAPFGSQANISRVKVDLPKQLPSRLTTLQKACTAAQFDANPAGCPPASFIGHARAVTPLIPVPLEGPAIFVSHGGEAFPSLIIVLQGYGVTLDLVGSTFISHAGITSSTFKTVPDAPVGSFELNLPEGKFSALAANGNLCKSSSKLKMPTEFVAQNGAKINESTKIAVTGCPKHKKTTKKKRKARRKGKKH
ncbi:MAG TPA: hypothetical protein VII53_04230 [Solirubrobacteraceae bacterium]